MGVGGICLTDWNGCADAVAYKFSSSQHRQSPGLMSINFPINERRDSFHDRIAFGFSTRDRDADLVHVVSGNSIDYISVQLVNQRLTDYANSLKK